MKRIIRLLFVGLLAGVWQSLDFAQCQNLSNNRNISHCYNTSSGNICFTTFLASNGRPLRKPLENASRWCNSVITGSSLIIIDSVVTQRAVEQFIGKQVLQNETVILDARKLSPRVNPKCLSYANGHSSVTKGSRLDETMLRRRIKEENQAKIRETDVRYEAQQTDVEANVEWKSGKSVAYCYDNASSLFSHICEGSRFAVSHQQNNKSYIVGEEVATWYDARNKCLRLGGDLASKTDLQKITNWSWLRENKRYWIRMHRKKWIWNTTGAAITYTNWDGGYPDEASDKQCICITCNSGNNRGACGYDQKWWACNCNHSYAFVCQKEEAPGDVITEINITGKLSSSTSEDFNSSVTLSIKLTTLNSSPSSSASSSVLSETLSPSKNTAQTQKFTRSTKANPAMPTSTETPITTIPSKTTASIEATVPTTPARSTESRTTAVVSPSTGLFKSFSTREILLTFFFVVVIFITIAVIFIIRKRRKRSVGLPRTNTTQSETVSSEYATLVPFNRPSDGDAIYTNLEMFKHPKLSKSTIYANIQPTSEEADMERSVDYANVDLPRKHQLKPRNAVKMTECFGLVYSQPDEPSSSASNMS